VLLYGGVCGLLTLQNSSYTLLRRYSSGVLKEEASSQSILVALRLEPSTAWDPMPRSPAPPLPPRSAAAPT
jgi:hypothetical protein